MADNAGGAHQPADQGAGQAPPAGQPAQPQPLVHLKFPPGQQMIVHHQPNGPDLVEIGGQHPPQAGILWANGDFWPTPPMAQGSIIDILWEGVQWRQLG